VNYFSYLLDAGKWGGDGGTGELLLQHLEYTVVAVLIGAVIAIPLGILIGHTGRGGFLVIGLSNAARAIPSIGLLVLVVLLTATGFAPTVLVLAVLALPAILTATATGVSGADPEAVYAAKAMGMTGGQVVSKVEWPLRSATLQVVATATVAAFAAGGGLGQLLISGQLSRDYPQMLAGAVLIAVLAILLDLLIGTVGLLASRRVRPAAKTRASAAPASA
jgi:osmoprotectant transport system permease protein